MNTGWKLIWRTDHGVLCETRQKLVFKSTFVESIRPGRGCRVISAGKSGEEKTTWCYRLWRVILLEPIMLKLTMRIWTSQINSMRVGALACLIVVGWYQDLHRVFWRSIHCPWHQDELSVSGIEEETGVTTVLILPWVSDCGYVHIAVCGCVWVVVLGVLLWGAICLCKVNKVIMNTVGFGIGW